MLVLTGADKAHVGTVEHGVRVGVTRVVRERSRTAGRVVTVRIVARHCNTMLNERRTFIYIFIETSTNVQAILCLKCMSVRVISYNIINIINRVYFRTSYICELPFEHFHHINYADRKYNLSNKRLKTRVYHLCDSVI